MLHFIFFKASLIGKSNINDIDKLLSNSSKADLLHVLCRGQGLFCLAPGWHEFNFIAPKAELFHDSNDTAAPASGSVELPVPRLMRKVSYFYLKYISNLYFNKVTLGANGANITTNQVQHVKDTNFSNRKREILPCPVFNDHRKQDHANSLTI